MNTFIEEMHLDQLGRLVLSDEQLQVIDGHVGIVTAGGEAKNTSCTNDGGCSGTTNGYCNNSMCDGSMNGHCLREPL
jgi:hypothetical protein